MPHAFDLGLEVMKAEIAKKFGVGYNQDQDLVFQKAEVKPVEESAKVVEEPKETLNEISRLLKQKITPELGKLRVNNLDSFIFILDVLTASVFANGKKLRQEIEKYFEAGRKMGLEVGTLSYRLSLEAEKERVKRKLSVVKEEIGEFFNLS